MGFKARDFSVLLTVLLLVVGGFGLSACKESTAESVPQAETVEVEDKAAAVETSAVKTPAVEIDLEAALKPRILGDANAPIKVTEFSSFTCSHCGDFHKETFKEFKANYLDTGKAYLVSKEFIRNRVDMHAAAVARCVQADLYFEFIQELFEQQEDWAYNANYLNFLKAKAQEYGVGGTLFQACIDSEELQAGILEDVRADQTKFGVNSTPTFVVNDKEKIGGGLPYGAFAKAIEDKAAAAQ